MNTLEKELVNGIFVDLDSLLDTRLPVVYYLDEELAATISNDNSYHDRITDRFGYLTNFIFNIFYKLRNKTILPYAAPTNILKIIHNYNIEAYADNRLTGGYKPSKLYLNIHPYKLLQEEIDNISIAISKAANIDDIVVVDIPINDITPQWLKDKISLLVMYDGMRWLEYHISRYNLIREPLIDTILLSPALLLGKKTNYKKIKDIDKFFKGVEESTSTLIKLKLLHPSEFSIQL